MARSLLWRLESICLCFFLTFFKRPVCYIRPSAPPHLGHAHTQPRAHTATHACALRQSGFHFAFVYSLGLILFLFLFPVTALLLTPFPAFRLIAPSKTTRVVGGSFYRGQWWSYSVFSLRHLCQISYYELLNHTGNALWDCRFPMGWFESVFFL